MTALLEEKLETLDMGEAHWSASTILAVFFAASLISAVFFGLGYTFGRGGAAKPALGIAAADAAASAPSNEQHPGQSMLARTGIVSPPIYIYNAAVARRAGNSARSAHVSLQQVSEVRATRAGTALAGRSRPTLVQSRRGSAVETGHARYMVQVGAVGNPRDARTLQLQLRRRGFHAGIYPGKHDRFLHVQIGPFATTEQADIVRHHIMANGYRAILKHAS